MRVKDLAAPGALAAAVSASSIAPAEPGSDRRAEVQCPALAAGAKAAGDQAMLAGDAAGALACYEEAYRHEPEPRGLYNRARASEFLGRHARALRLLHQFRKAADESLLSRVPQLDDLMRELGARVTQLQITSDVGGAEIWLNSERVGTLPLESLPVEPGRHRLELRAEGHEPFVQQVDAAAGQRLVVSAELRKVELSAAQRPLTASVAPAAHSPAPSALERPTVGTIRPTQPPMTAAPSGDRRSLYGWAALGVGGAGAAIAVVSFFAARSARDRICPDGSSACAAEELDDGANGSFETWRGVYYGSLITAGVGLGGGTLLLWSSKPDSAASEVSSSPVQVQARLHGDGFYLQGSF